jgi:hypothetical protein
MRRSLPGLKTPDFFARHDLNGVAAATRRDARFNEATFAFAGRFCVGDEFWRRLIVGAKIDITVQLECRFQRFQATQRFQRFNVAPFFRAVAHYRHMGLDRIDQHRIVAGIQSVMRHHEHFHLPQRVVRRDQFGFNIPGQIPATQEGELAERHQETQTLGIVRGILWLWLILCRQRIGLTGIRDHVSAGGDHLNLERRFA